MVCHDSTGWDERTISGCWMHNVARRASRSSLAGDAEMPRIDVYTIKNVCQAVTQLACRTAGHS